LLLFLIGCQKQERINVLIPDSDEFIIMNFDSPISLDPIEPGWRHRTFFRHKPMTIEFVNKEGTPSIKLSTKNTASILSRYVDYELAEYPIFNWKWFIEKPIETDINESTRKGDDSAARFIFGFQTADDHRSMEIIWGTKLHAGEYKYVGNYPHYVANGGVENAGKWFDEEINLLKIYETIWPDKKPARVTTISLFADTDETGAESIVYFGNVFIKKK